MVKKPVKYKSTGGSLEDKIAELVINHLKTTLSNSLKKHAEEKAKVKAGAKTYRKLDAMKRIDKVAPTPNVKHKIHIVPPEESAGVTPKPELKEREPIVEPVIEPAVSQETVDNYQKISPDAKRTKETGEYIHHKYKFGAPLFHSEKGPVQYVATFSSEGSPLVQPVDDDEIPVGKPFQAKPESLTER